MRNHQAHGTGPGLELIVAVLEHGHLLERDQPRLVELRELLGRQIAPVTPRCRPKPGQILIDDLTNNRPITPKQALTALLST